MSSDFLTANWNAPKNVRTLITTKNLISANTRSHSNISGFNLATHVNDDINHVRHNRNILNQFLPDPPHWLLQTHSKNVLEIDRIVKPLPEYHNYDAAITATKNKVCVVLTADCIPILLTDVAGSFVASIHAGRVGIAHNIIQNTIHKINVSATQILAYIAPSICQKHYEVGEDIFEEFELLDPRYLEFFQKKKALNKFDLDLNGIAVLQLLDMGLLPSNIYHSGICTYCQSDRFYSYRKNNNTGRFASLIWLT